MRPALQTLSSADRGFVTWLATMLREAVDDVWARLTPGVSSGGPTPDGESGTRVTTDGELIEVLDLAPIGPRLRFVAGANRKLSLPIAGLDALAELDCSGLDLDVLDVRLLPRLRALRCADNRLRELDLSASPNLEVLDCARNQLMVLDLRHNTALRELGCAENGLALLVLPGAHAEAAGEALESIEASDNQLMTLDLGDRPRLRRVLAGRNALARVHVGQVPALRDLDLSHNDLGAVSLGGAPALERLTLADNRLAACDVAGLTALRELRCAGNYVAELDLAACPEIEVVDARRNQLQSVAVGAAPRLVELDLADNRLPALEVRAPALLRLDLARNLVARLDLRGVPALRSLDVSRNPLRALDLRPAADLIELDVRTTRIEALDVRANPNLTRLRAGGVPVTATLVQQRRLAELRGDAAPSGGRPLEDLDAYELHDLAVAATGRDTAGELLRIVSAPRCDLGTALMVYWTNSPHYYRRYAQRDEVPAYELPGWDLLAAIEDRVTRNGFAHAEIPFDPTDDRHTRTVHGVDWTQPAAGSARVAPARPVPEQLSVPVRGGDR